MAKQDSQEAPKTDEGELFLQFVGTLIEFREEAAKTVNVLMTEINSVPIPTAHNIKKRVQHKEMVKRCEDLVTNLNEISNEVYQSHQKYTKAKQARERRDGAQGDTGALGPLVRRDGCRNVQ